MSGRLVLLVLLLSSALAFAQPEEGKDYVIVPAPANAKGSNVDLVEFFYYGCPQCLELEPFLLNWLKHHQNVNLIRIPAFKTSWLPLAKAFYALEILGQESRLRPQIFNAIQVQGIDLTDEPVLFNWVGQHGIKPDEFESVYASSAVSSRIEDSISYARRFGITGVPSLVVGEKYLVLGNLARASLLDQLVAMARHPSP